MDRFLEQVAIEASQMYVTETGKPRFADTVGCFKTDFSSIFLFKDQFFNFYFLIIPDNRKASG